jgi:hypothetical protein
MEFLLTVDAELTALAAFAAGAAPPRNAAAPASTPPVSNSRRRLVRALPPDGDLSGSAIVSSFACGGNEPLQISA